MIKQKNRQGRVIHDDAIGAGLQKIPAKDFRLGGGDGDTHAFVIGQSPGGLHVIGYVLKDVIPGESCKKSRVNQKSLSVDKTLIRPGGGS